MKYISTSALAKERGLDSKDLFQDLSNKGWLYRDKKGSWTLTKSGRAVGGDLKNSVKYGEYVVWPSDIDLEQKVDKDDMLNATTIGKEFDVSARSINSTLAELGWMEKSPVGGWAVTKYGSKVGGVQMEAQNGSPYVLWHKRILSNKDVLKALKRIKGEDYEDQNIVEEKFSDIDAFRQSHEAKYRTSDGHRVRSRGEAMIDDYLYRAGIVHAYERMLPGIEEEVLSDFYLPLGKVFIEYWGIEEDEKYAANKKRKLEIYEREEFNLIQLTNDDIYSLDDVLPRKLKQFGIRID